MVKHRSQARCVPESSCLLCHDDEAVLMLKAHTALGSMAVLRRGSSRGPWAAPGSPSLRVALRHHVCVPARVPARVTGAH